MEPLWEICRPDPHLVKRLAADLSCHPATAAVLVNRNITDAHAARRFITDGLGQLPAPFELKGLEAAAQRIFKAVRNRERILIFGDYDVDGIAATALMVKFLARLDAQVDFYVPHRIREGYGIKPVHIQSLALPRKVDLIITVDCGISAHEAVQLAAENGIEVIVTDHHRVGETLPPAAAVINPQRSDCPSGLELLSGAGVAFYLLIYLRKYFRERRFWDQRDEPSLSAFCDLAALGTVADMMPLIGVNRLLVKAGLDLLNRRPRPGLAALMQVSRLGANSVDAEDLAFRLAPRLNAAGRIGHAHSALRLLITPNQDQAHHLAHNLDKLNLKRQEIEGRMVAEILTRLDSHPHLLEDPALVLADEAWHEGVLGIAASRIARQFHRPVVLFALRAGRGRGSARSVDGFDLYRALARCRSDLAGFGGHAMAAGVEIAARNLDAFRNNFLTLAAQSLDSETRRPVLVIDQELNLDRIDHRLIDELEMLQPYGNTNPAPLFMARKVKVAAHRNVGDCHRRLTLEQNHFRLEAIQFNIPSRNPPPAHFERIAYRLKWNRWKGVKKPQILMEAVEFPIAS